MLRLALTAALASVLLPAQQVVAPASTTHGAITATKDGLTLPAGEFTVAELIDATAAYLCRNYLYDHHAVGRAAGFTLQRPIALDALGSEELLHALLATRDFLVVPIDELRGVHQIVAIGPDAPILPATAIPWRSPDEILRRPRLREVVMTAIDLRYADAHQLSNALRAHFATGGVWRPGQLMAFAAEPRTLLLHGNREQVAQVLLLAQQIERLSAPTPPPTPSLLQRLADLEQQVAALKQQAKAR